jgi:DNA polymerase-3 subunit epsilon
MRRRTLRGSAVTLAESLTIAGSELGIDLLKCLMERGGVPPPWVREISGAEEFQWPEVSGWDVQLAARGTAPPRRPAGWLDRIVARMPRHEDVRVESYLEALESALLDCYLSCREEEALATTAEALGLSRQVLDEIH